MNRVTLTRSTFERLLETVGSLPAESGAAIGAEQDRPELISRVWFDEEAGWGNRFYTPTREGLEAAVGQWQQEGCAFRGIVHSHPDDQPTLSPMDERAGAAFLAANDLPEILLGLFCRGELSFFRLTCPGPGDDPRLEPLSVTVISAD